ncbi:MAG TPA: hypothetical protein VFJ57_02415 [Solirubrobacterales bacterium]|nr:hypothetical protein [Solirubrobacterales bacterium]
MNGLPKVVLCDDEEETADEWKRDLEALPGVGSRFEIAVVEKPQFNDDIRVLEERRTKLRPPDSEQPVDGGTIFDEAAILIVDYDLYEYNPAQLFSGDSVAYLARSYSTCGYIVGVNQDRIPNPFDAKLTAHQQLPTDVSIGGSQVANPGLWCKDREHWVPFRPWYWPLLPERAAALPVKAKEMEGRLEEPLAEVLGLDEAEILTMPRDVVAPLDVPERIDLPQVPIREWVLRAQMGLRSGDVLLDDSQIARVAAARLGKWLDRVLLPGQDYLVDAPHLVERRPGLLSAPSDQEPSWQAVVALGDEVAGLDAERIAAHRFGDGWLSRPVWRWGSIASDQDLDAAADAPRVDPPIVFAEDQSRFIEASGAQRFRSAVDSPFKGRWLGVPDNGVTYLPAVRLSSG